MLHFAVYGNQLETVKLLLELGADVTLDGKWNELVGTPLNFAEQRDYAEMIQILEEYKGFQSMKYCKIFWKNVLNFLVFK